MSQSFGDLSTDAGLQKLNDFLKDHEFIGGKSASDADKAAVKEVKGDLFDQSKYPFVARWLTALNGNKDEDEDDVDLFASSDEEVDEEAERVKAQRLEEYRKKKEAKGPAPAAKSMVTLDVKPWDDETPMDELTKNVLAIEMDGLVWGGHQLVDVGYGVKKLQINCVVEDDKVSMDELSELITEDEDHVQSVDVAAMAKV